MASTSRAASSSMSSGSSGNGGGGVLGVKRKADQVESSTPSSSSSRGSLFKEAVDPIDNEEYVESFFRRDEKKRNKAALIFDILDEVCNKSNADSFACGGTFPTPLQTPPSE